MKLRKTEIIKETTETDGFGKACDPVTRVVAIAVVQNPFVRAFGEDLSPLFNLNRRSVGMPTERRLRLKSGDRSSPKALTKGFWTTAIATTRVTGSHALPKPSVSVVSLMISVLRSFIS